MGAYTTFFKTLKKKGFNAAVKSTLRYLTGIDDNINTLHYILNRLVDVRTFPKATGPLRELQECDTLLLEIFHFLCNANNITYWIDYGTLLGAVRNGGFLPWDDDVDIAICREQYERAYSILKEKMAPYGIVVKKDNGHIGIGYKHSITGIWIDVFPVDCVKISKQSMEIKEIQIEKAFEKLRKYCKKHSSLIEDEKFLKIESKKRMQIIDRLNDYNGQEKILIHGVETFGLPKKICNHNLVFPISTTTFENIELNSPADSHGYLRNMYGDDYLQFPKTGVEHHDGGKGLQISQWSVENKTNMSEIKEELITILKRVKKG